MVKRQGLRCIFYKHHRHSLYGELGLDLKQMLRTEMTLMTTSNIGPELKELFDRISSPQSRKAALSLFTATSQELASTYQAENSDTPAQQTLLDIRPPLSSHTDENT